MMSRAGALGIASRCSCRGGALRPGGYTSNPHGRGGVEVPFDKVAREGMWWA